MRESLAYTFGGAGISEVDFAARASPVGGDFDEVYARLRRAAFSVLKAFPIGNGPDQTTNLAILCACLAGAGLSKLWRSLTTSICAVYTSSFQGCAIQDAQRTTSTPNGSRAGFLHGSSRLRPRDSLNVSSVSPHRTQRLNTLPSAAGLIQPLRAFPPIFRSPPPNLRLHSLSASSRTRAALALVAQRELRGRRTRA